MVLANRRPMSDVVLAILWLAATAGGGLALLPGFTAAAVMFVSSLAFMLLLSWRLAQAAPGAPGLPDVFPRLGAAASGLVVVLGLTALVLLGLALGPALAAIGGIGLAGAVLSLAWRRQLTRAMFALAAGAGLVTLLGVGLLGNGDWTWGGIHGLAAAFCVPSGLVLVGRTGLGRLRLLGGDPAGAGRGFLWGCLLGWPAALLNLAGGMQGGDTWAVHWWQPLYAIVPAVAEEAWARLLLVGLLYALLRPALGGSHGRALAAVVLSSLVHGFGHTGIHPVGLTIGALLYGIPSALLFVNRDLEHAAGYNFVVDFVRFAAAVVT